ncbi:unnamed protein product [Ilex paraguariensis]|uniref:U3 small nucleolar RNA-associated protein 13 C-terminal domain-containing protein n=1 Tax=Ilex paraguariensis TaxID=185542 RepID=A0ABC8T5C2_9AQUA
MINVKSRGPGAAKVGVFKPKVQGRSSLSPMSSDLDDVEEGVLKGQELENVVSDVDYTKEIEKAFHALGKEEYHLLLEYVREWNPKPKLCHIAQFVLFRAFNMLPPKEIIERHFSRIDRLERSTFLLDYCLTGMSIIEPEMEEKEIEDKSVMHSNEADEEQLAKTVMVEQEQDQDHAEQKEKSSSKK